MFRVKIFGAGSIGNHLAHASRSLGWNVTVCDVNQDALDRMKNDIYPTRYGKWDTTIEQYTNQNAPKGGFDLIIIGTPPEYHIPLALESLEENPKGLLIEKPLCGPELEGAAELYEKAKNSNTKVFVGYTHVVGKATVHLEKLLKEKVIGEIQTFDVEFREHWEGIFKAHPWLNGPEDTYLGYWKRGGGASGEHSHALNLWQHLSHVLNFGRVSEVNADLTYIKQGEAEYDDICLLQLRTERGLIGRVVQDVVTKPSQKWARIQGTKGMLEWFANYDSEGDAIIVRKAGEKPDVLKLPKKRPDDFIDELKHVEPYLKSSSLSPLALERGLDTMLVLEACHQSETNKQRIKIDYNKGYKPQAELAKS